MLQTTSSEADLDALHADSGSFSRPRGGLLVIGFAVLLFLVPGLLALGRNVWSTEEGAQGPIILATGTWLLFREFQGVAATRSLPRLSISLLAISILGVVAVFASMIGKLWVQWAACYGVVLAVIFAYIGVSGFRRMWFSLFYLAFLIPPPAGVIVPLTRMLKLRIADGAIAILSGAGFDVAKSGASLFIDSFELMVAAACSGMNSLVSLLAVGLFYVHLRHRADIWYSLVLAALIIPVALFANLARVIILLLVTHYFGIGAAQGIIHEAAGLTTFFIALITLILLDLLLEPLFSRLRGRPAYG